jgi:hypothetical protein
MRHIDMGVRWPMGRPSERCWHWHSEEQPDGAARNSDVTNNFPRVPGRAFKLQVSSCYTSNKTTYPDPFGSPAPVRLISFGSQKLRAVLAPLQDFTELSESMPVPHW